MAFATFFQTSRSFVTSLLIVALLNSHCHCESEEFTLQDFTCAKAGADGLPKGFSLTRDDQLKLDLSESPDGKPLYGLLLNAMGSEQQLVISVVAVNKTSCRKSFNNSVSLMAESGQCYPDASKEGKDDQPLGFVCAFPMGQITGLPNARYFTITWNKTDSKDAQCKWNATIDGIRVLLKTSSDASEKCWEEAPSMSWPWICAICVGAFVLLAVIIGVAFVCWRQPNSQTSVDGIYGASSITENGIEFIVTKPYNLGHLQPTYQIPKDAATAGGDGDDSCRLRSAGAGSMTIVQSEPNTAE
ncbi:hypothetical protein GPALN_007886 [Globodera pallida]|uniref:Reelin domain-containing protein n=1 Tax=Globodera pallida TaxID=36090 RepID=A0A183C7Z5_GLOPA|nr:hypothetical protein GPALN_007886 [Globodera pallida]